jgi:predicted secreted protein
MKKMFLSLLAALSLLSASAQVNTSPNPYPRTITVTGSAEREVVPDEIYVNVELKEYEKKGTGRIGLEGIRRDFLNAARATGLPDSAITIASYDGSNYNWWQQRKRRKEELYAGITYQVKLSSSRQLDDLVNRLDENATQNFYIARVDHSRLAEFRKQLKIAAVKAAKDKAQYLAEPIGERIGEAVSIAEPTEFGWPQPMMVRSANVTMRNQSAETDGGDINQPDFRKIKLKYDVNVVFALK